MRNFKNNFLTEYLQVTTSVQQNVESIVDFLMARSVYLYILELSLPLIWVSDCLCQNCSLFSHCLSWQGVYSRNMFYWFQECWNKEKKNTWNETKMPIKTAQYSRTLTASFRVVWACFSWVVWVRLSQSSHYCSMKRVLK